MSVVDDLHRIRLIWISKVSNRLARGEGLRVSFRDEVDRFYDGLLQSVESGNPAWIEPVVSDWVEASTMTELEENSPSLSPVLDQLMSLTHETANENLDPVSALKLVGAILPVYSHAFDRAATLESKMRIDHITAELDKAKDVLERLDKSKSDFISIAAHELKTPLTLIEGYAAMLEEQLKQDPEKAVSMLYGIGNGTRRLREIIDDMIDVSLIDNDLLSLNFQPVWLNRLLDVIDQEVEQIIVDRGLLLTIRQFPGSEEMLFADAERLYQALRNVVQNAIKFTPDGGKILIDGRKLPGFVEIIVQDTGIGIDLEYHAKIFEKFGRLGSVGLHSSGKTKFKGGGPGLGLPIAKGVIEAHGGAIWVESEGHDEDRYPGTTFHILIPLRKEPPDEGLTRIFDNFHSGNRDRAIAMDNIDDIKENRKT